MQWFTDANHAIELVANMKSALGQMPRYYQVLLRVKYKDSVPTQDVVRLLYHDLTDPARAAKPAR